MINNDFLLDEQFQGDPQDIIIENPLLESDSDPSTTVYSVEFIKNDLCSRETETMTIVEFDTCINYAEYEVGISYISLFLGLVIGFILSKAVADGWT